MQINPISVSFSPGCNKLTYQRPLLVKDLRIEPRIERALNWVYLPRCYPDVLHEHHSTCLEIFFFPCHILGVSIFHNPRDFSLFLQKYLNISKKNNELLSTNNILGLIIFFLSPPLPIHLPNFVLPEAISNGLTYLQSTVISTRLKTASYHHQIILYHNQIIKHDQGTYTCNIFFWLVFPSFKFLTLYYIGGS